MIEKSYLQQDGVLIARVNFSLPNSIVADTVHLVGDFNGWDTDSTPFQRTEDGGWFLTLDLPSARAYQFRYLYDGRNWANDSETDAYVYNRFGSDNCVLITDPAYKRYDI